MQFLSIVTYACVDYGAGYPYEYSLLVFLILVSFKKYSSFEVSMLDLDTRLTQ
jgi:hypothetical protein